MTDSTSDSKADEFDDVVDRLSAAVEGTENDDSSGQTGTAETVDVDEIVDSDGDIGLYDARDIGRAIAGDLIGSPLDGIIEVGEQDDDGWRVVAEVVERTAVPDTQDILGRYVISLEPDGTVHGYGRAGRYRRGSVETQSEIFATEER
ncbi:gas vesicle protein GvpO (plasmid) [Haladaptatus sp. SPP-AMP-3]|uniref:gas vesicle protein GvpO n=1 Tax=Haladaptatus sp. SPP-AMP-3 TaxID=3121295 RepID=UPI003C3090B6